MPRATSSACPARPRREPPAPTRDEWRAALEALPDEPGPWTPEQDALLCKYWGKKPKDLLMPFLLKLTGRPPHAIKCRTEKLRAEGRDIGRYIAKPTRR